MTFLLRGPPAHEGPVHAAAGTPNNHAPGSRPMAVKEGDTVAVHYTGRLEDGEVFDSSAGGDPIQFTVGEAQVIPGFEAAVVGREVGDKATVKIPPEQAYGERDDKLVQQLDRAQIGGEGLDVGQRVSLQDQAGRPFQAEVVEADESSITLDFNHMLAGKTLAFEIELVAVE